MAHARTSSPDSRHASSTSSPEPARKLVFGVYQTDKPTVVFRQFSAITEFLSRRLTSELQEDVQVELKILPSYESGLEAIVTGTVDFTRVGPATYVMARRQNPDVTLLAMELVKGEKTFKGVIVVREDSSLRKIEDLAGTSFAFGNPNSTIGRYLAQRELVNAGIHARDLERFNFLERHDVVARAVELGDYDAGSIKIGTFRKVNTSGRLRILVEFDNVTKPWVARAGLDERLVHALSSALISCDDEAALKTLKVSGFAEASDDEYDFVREAMARSEAFEEDDSN